MGMLLAVITFFALVAAIGIVRVDEEDYNEFADAPRRTPDPSPRDIYAVTGTLGSAPVPSWG
ncbi:MAG: hypothetical protein KDC46_13615 [Thermoleophilia bacterium]|nr:hypothetical protein [Thermoleophilia bacterium]